VKEQINVARGNKISFKQEDIKLIGHAIEVRVYAEDPANNFLPDIGKLRIYNPPKGPGVRVDDGFEEGMEIPIYYDSMISKLITYGKDREEAIQRMIRAIDEYKISGVETTLSFCKFVMQHKAFTSGKFDTHFVAQYFKPEMLNAAADNEENNMLAALVADIFVSKSERKQFVANTVSENKATSNWRKRRDL